MVPDVVLATDSADRKELSRVIVLDAKYRISDGLNDSLSSIHSYRDALVREAKSGIPEGVVRAAYLLSPFIPALESAYRTTPLPGRLFHPEYRSRFRFGAVTLRPGMSTAEIRQTLRLIVTDAGAALEA